MRVATVVAAGLFVLLAFQAGGAQGLGQRQSVSGRLIFEHAASPCEPCAVDLLFSGVQPVATTYTDGAGGFTFPDVRPGSYTIRVSIPGFEEVRQDFSVADSAFSPTLTIMMTPRPVANKSDGAGGIVDVSQFTQSYPKKAVDAYKKAGDSRKKGKKDDTIKYLEQAIDIAPDFYNAHLELGVAYREAGRTEDGERELLKAHDLNQSSADPLVNLTGLYLDQNKPDRAVTTGEAAVKANSTSPSAFLNLGMALYKLAMLDKAEVALKKALDLAPKMFQARLMLANVYLKEQRYDNLMEQLDRYLAENPNGDQRGSVQQMRDQLISARAQNQP